MSTTPSELQAGAVRQALRYAAEYLRFQTGYRRIVGVQAAVRLGDSLELSSAWGHADLEAGTPLTTRHLFRIASHSKTFTATAVLQLVEAGRLRLDDTAGQHITALADAGSPLAAVTVRELLSHSAGITRDSADGDFWQLRRPFPNRAELLEVLCDPAAKILPANERFKYSNIGYGLLGLIIEAVTGTDYAEHVRGAVVRRLGLADVGPEPEVDRLADLACGYGSLAHGEPRARIANVDTAALAPATGFYATAADLTAYFAAHFTGDDRLLSDHSKRLMRQQLWRIEGAQHHRYGLGLATSDVGDRTVVGHGGNYPGHNTASLFDPDARLAVSVLTNSVDGPASDLARAVIRLIDLAGQRGGAARSDAGAADGDESLRRFAGRFAGLWGVTDVALLGGRLYVVDPTRTDPTEDCVALDPVGDGEFRVSGGSGYGAYGERLRYRMAPDGSVESIRTAGGLTLVPQAQWAGQQASPRAGR